MRVLVIGAGGYVGSRTVPVLLAAGHEVVAGAQDPGKLDGFWWGDRVRRVALDVSDEASVHAAIDGDPRPDVVVYLVHGMGGDHFREVDLAAARTVRATVDASEVRAVVYLSGIIPDVPREELSEHLVSRLEVEEELSRVRCRFVALRAAVILGAGSTSFELMSQLAHRLPVTVQPDWMDHLVEPVAIVDVAAALHGAVGSTASGIYDVGGGERIPYPALVGTVLRHTGQERPALTVPVLPQALVQTIASRLSDIPSSTVSALIESLREDMVAGDRRWVHELLPEDHGPLVPLEDAVRRSVAAPDPLLPPSQRDPMGPLPGDPVWAGNGTGD